MLEAIYLNGREVIRNERQRVHPEYYWALGAIALWFFCAWLVGPPSWVIEATEGKTKRRKKKNARRMDVLGDLRNTQGPRGKGGWVPAFFLFESRHFLHGKFSIDENGVRTTRKMLMNKSLLEILKFGLLDSIVWITLRAINFDENFVKFCKVCIFDNLNDNQSWRGYIEINKYRLFVNASIIIISN